VDNFTLAEIKTLLVKQVMPWRDQDFNWLYQVPTLNETVQFLQAKQHELNKTIGLLIEEKSPAYYASIGLAMEPILLAILSAYNYSLNDSQPAAVIVQSFESTSLQLINATTKLPLIMLLSGDLTAKVGDLNITYADLITNDGLKNLSSYCYGIGPDLTLIYPEPNNSYVAPNTSLIYDANQHGLKVVSYTFRSDPQYLNTYYANPIDEYLAFFKIGLDGAITDFPDTGVIARELFMAQANTNVLEEGEIALIIISCISVSIIIVLLFFGFRGALKHNTKPQVV